MRPGHLRDLKPTNKVRDLLATGLSRKVFVTSAGEEGVGRAR